MAKKIDIGNFVKNICMIKMVREAFNYLFLHKPKVDDIINRNIVKKILYDVNIPQFFITLINDQISNSVSTNFTLY